LGWKSSPQGDGRTARHVRKEGKRRPFMICWPCLFDLRFFIWYNPLLAPLPSNHMISITHRHERGIDACSCFTRYLFPDQVIDHQIASWRGQRIAERKVQRKEVRFVSLGASVKKH
jgi:hypothetical protein